MSTQTIPMSIAAEAQLRPTSLIATLPGVALLFSIGLAGKLLEHAFTVLRIQHHLLLPQIEYVLWAILLGLLISNTFGVAAVFRPGVATYELWLKLGIVLVGARFLLQDVLHIGGLSLALVAVELVLSLSVMTVLGRIFHLPPKLTSLLAIGSSICGVTAIMAAQGAIDPDEEDTSTAIAAILTLGAIALFTFPAIGHLLHMGQQAYGMWAGLAVDNTAESIVTGSLFGPEAGRWADSRQDCALFLHRIRRPGLRRLLGVQGPGRARRATSRSSCGRSFPSSSSAFSPSRPSPLVDSSPTPSSTASPTSPAGPSCPPLPESACAPTSRTWSARDGVR